MNLRKLIAEIDNLLIRVGRNYEGASHPALLVTNHREEILSLFESYIKSVEMSDEEIRPLMKGLNDSYLPLVHRVVTAFQSKLIEKIEEIRK